MRIKTLGNSVVVMLLLTAGAYAQQGQSSTVAVSQEFLNSSHRSFQENVLLRTAVDAQAKAITAMEERDKAKDELITSERALSESRAREIKVLLEQVEIYKRMKCDKDVFLFVFKKIRCK